MFAVVSPACCGLCPPIISKIIYVQHGELIIALRVCHLWCVRFYNEELQLVYCMKKLTLSL